ncbi:hypothetical protein ZIOFF_044228 [Zingiber officinale]|uniref:Uncharacterized protein n=1 Tax=Zingiber officinale TaxID=94328 RepID=A0A8J5GBQ1_ZINOF|nr:hypothetical protein ZIOFF_044228 [Zingiber officinale]
MSATQLEIHVDETKSPAGEETIVAEGKFDSNEMKDNTDHADQDPSPSIVEEVKLSEIGMIFSSEEKVSESDEICSVLVEIMKDTKEKLIIAMENGQSRAEQLEEASTSGAKVMHSPLKGVASSDPNSGFS